MEKQKGFPRALRALAKHQVVTTADIAQAYGISRVQAAQTAHRLAQRGILKSLQKGLYAVVPLHVEPARFQPDRVLVVHRGLGGQAAFSHHTAAELHGASQQARRAIHVCRKDARARRLQIGGIPVHVHNLPGHEWDASLQRLRYGRETIQVTMPERTLVDLVGMPRVDYFEVRGVLAALRPALDPQRLIEGAKRWGGKTTQARLGHLLARDWPRDDTGWSIIEARLGELRVLQSPVYFGTRPNNPGNRLDKTCNVVVPEEEG